MAEEPFCFSLKYSCASRTSVRCRCRNLDGNLVERAADDGQRRNVGRVPVALDHLRGHRRRLQPEPLRRCSLRAPASDARRCPPRPKACPRACLRPRRQSGRRLRSISAYQLSSLRPNVVGSAWMPCVRPMVGVCLNSMRAALEHRQQRGNPLADQRRSFLHLQRLRRIDNVVRREPVVQPAGLGVEPLRLQALGNRRGEGDHVVLHFGLDLLRRARRRRWPWSAMASAAAAGITPSSASTRARRRLPPCSQQRYLFSSVQMRPIAGRV